MMLTFFPLLARGAFPCLRYQLRAGMAGAGAGGGMEFRVEDSALVYQGKMLYEAKV